MGHAVDPLSSPPTRSRHASHPRELALGHVRRGAAGLHTMLAMTPTEQLRSRLLGYRPTDTLWGWLGPSIVAAVGGFLRFWNLGQPHELVFDETYYVKQGVSMFEYGYERRVSAGIKSPDALFTQGTPNVFGTEGDLVVHPPVGKWIIGFGEHLFGYTSSFGWRFSVAPLASI